MNQVVLTTVLTIIGGVLIFVLGQIFLKAFIEPILKLRAFRGTIADSLVYYCNVYYNPGLSKEEDAQKASKELRKLGSELMAKTTVVPLYSLWSFLRFIPKMSDILNTHRNLIGLSNGVLGLPNELLRKEPHLSVTQVEGNIKLVEEIKISLHLPTELLR